MHYTEINVIEEEVVDFVNRLEWALGGCVHVERGVIEQGNIELDSVELVIEGIEISSIYVLFTIQDGPSFKEHGPMRAIFKKVNNTINSFNINTELEEMQDVSIYYNKDVDSMEESLRVDKLFFEGIKSKLSYEFKEVYK